jgi:DNA-binding transcriptional regulator YhcF (GntR family)
MASPPQISVDLSSTVPVRRQIVDQLRAFLVQGQLAPGMELPSVRKLAIDLGVHFNTVAESYRLLADEGWLEIVHGRAARVRDRETPVAPEAAAMEPFRQRMQGLVAEMRAQGFGVARIARELTAIVEGMK